MSRMDWEVYDDTWLQLRGQIQTKLKITQEFSKVAETIN